MEKRREAGLRRVLMVTVPALGLAMALVGATPAAPTLAQSNAGGSINIGGDIADTVTGAVASISTGSGGGGTASGGVSVQSDEISFGEDEGVAISDASGGNYNASATRK